MKSIIGHIALVVFFISLGFTSRAEILITDSNDLLHPLPLVGMEIWRTTDSGVKPPFSSHPDVITPTNFIDEKGGKDELYYWARVVITNGSSSTLSTYLVVDNPMVGEIQLFLQDTNGLQHLYTTGDNYPYMMRPVIKRNFVFPIELEGNESKTYYWRIYNEGRRLYAPFYAMQPDAYDYKEQTVMTYTVVNYGIMLAIALVAFVMYFFLKAKSLIILSGLVFALFGINVMSGGIGFIVFIPNNPELYNRLQHGTLYLATYFMLLYSFSYLKPIMDRFPVLRKVFQVHLWVILAMAISVILSYKALNFFAPVVYLLALWGFLVSIVVALYTITKNIKESVYYIVALVIGLISSVLYYIHIFQPVTFDNIITSPMLLGGASAFLFVLLMAELERVRLLRKKNETAMEELAILYEERKEAAASLEKEVLITQRELEREKKIAGLAVLKGEEQERKRIATELHDGIGSLLTVLRLQLDILGNGTDKEDKLFTETLKNSNKLLDTAYEELKGITEKVLPTVLQHFGLKRAVEDLAKQVNSANKLRLITRVNIQSVLSSTMESAVYRITLEVVTNILKHAHATEASVSIIEQDGYIHIKGTDNGSGFDINNSAPGNGLKNMRNRAVALSGNFSVISNKGKGTSVIIAIPIAYE